MTPTTLRPNIINALAGYIKLFTGFGSFNFTFERKDMLCSFIIKCRPFICSPNSGFAPSFFDAIRNIIQSRPYKKMIRIHANRIITGMTNMVSVAYSALERPIRKPMRPDVILLKPKSPIARCIRTSCINPAGVSFVYFCKKSFDSIVHRKYHAAVPSYCQLNFS